MFQILRYFSITSFVVITVIAMATLSLVVLYRQLTVSELVELEASRNVALTQVFANSIWPRFASYVTSVSAADGNKLRARPETAQIRKAVIALMQNLPVLKIKIYNLDGLTVFSTDPDEMGVQKASNTGFFMAAREGRVMSDVTHRGKFNAFDRELQDRDILESYLPLRQGDGPVEAVFELYSDVTVLLQRIDQVQRNLLVGLIVAFGLIYGGLFLIVRRGNMILKRQYGDILRAQEDIKVKNEELNRELLQNERLSERVRRAATGATARNERFLRRISADLHDGPAQSLGLALLRLDSVVTAHSEGCTCDEATLSQTNADWDIIQSSLGDALNEIRTISSGLVLPELDDLSLPETLVRVTSLHKRRTETEVELDLDKVPDDASLPLKITIYRFVQEALANAYHHAGGRGQKVRVIHDADRLHVQVSDRGPGLDSNGREQNNDRLGLEGMRQRVESIGGTFRIESKAGLGTHVVADLPLELVADEYAQ